MGLRQSGLAYQKCWGARLSPWQLTGREAEQSATGPAAGEGPQVCRGGGNILLRNLFILVFINENIYSDGILTWERERDLSICLLVKHDFKRGSIQ